MHWFFYCIRHYANFRGRAGRAEFWSFQACAFLTGILIAALGKSAPVIGVFALWFFWLLITLPSVAVATRRLHDVGYSGALLKRMTTLGVTQLAFWFGVYLSHGHDSLALWSAYLVSIASLLFWVVLMVIYLKPGHRGPNAYGTAAPASPLLSDWDRSPSL